MCNGYLPEEASGHAVCTKADHTRLWYGSLVAIFNHDPLSVNQNQRGLSHCLGSFIQEVWLPLSHLVQMRFSPLYRVITSVSSVIVCIQQCDYCFRLQLRAFSQILQFWYTLRLTRRYVFRSICCVGKPLRIFVLIRNIIHLIGLIVHSTSADVLYINTLSITRVLFSITANVETIRYRGRESRLGIVTWISIAALLDGHNSFKVRRCTIMLNWDIILGRKKWINFRILERLSTDKQFLFRSFLWIIKKPYHFHQVVVAFRRKTFQ